MLRQSPYVVPSVFSYFPSNHLLLKAIFSSPFFSMDRTVSPPNFLISDFFWIFWSVVGPVTIIVILLWLASHHITVKRWEKALRSHLRSTMITSEVGGTGRGQHVTGDETMRFLICKAVDGFDLSISSLLDQAVYHPCDPFWFAK
jgi:hypothetical protein